MQIDLSEIQNMIYVIRGEKVMLDSDLANLYGVKTKRLNEQVRRNLDRFPEDFMFECNSEDLEVLRSQIATSNAATNWNYRRRYMPMLFTENGVAMLSSVLNSKQAIEVNISIMRIFTKLRSYFALERRIETNEKKINVLDNDVTRVFRVVFERLDRLEEKPKTHENRKKIGLNNKD